MRGKQHIGLAVFMTFLLGIAGVGGFAPPSPATAHELDVENVDVFYEPLATHGNWVTVPEHGRVWVPRGMRAGWRPYTDGRWVYTDYGWTWVSDHEWGWAPFHYGRWDYTNNYGWYWVPDRVWSPAWVSWRHSPGWVGWAPLPPRVGFSIGIGLGAAQADVHIDPGWFSFVEERRILAPRLRSYYAPRERNVNLVHVTKNVTNYVVVNQRIVNQSIEVDRVERVTRRPVVRHRVIEAESPEAVRGPRIREREREVVIARPVRATAEAREARERREANQQQPRSDRRA